MSTKVETDGADSILAIEFLIYDEGSGCLVAPNSFALEDDAEDDQYYSENESPMQL